MDKVKICAVCMHSEPSKIDENLDKTRRFCIKAKLEDAQIVCFPELSITGYVLKDPQKVVQGHSAQQIIDSLISISKELGLIIIAGIIELESHFSYITQVIVDDHGLIGKYRKTHLSPLEKGSYNAGNKIDIYYAKDISFGIQLCYETHFPELSTIMAIKGAELIFAPHASPRGSPKDKLNSWLRHLKARAFDNTIFLVACNQVGKTKEGFYFPGVALAIDPQGRIIKKLLTEEEDMLVVNIDKDLLLNVRSNKMGFFLPNRRPELYKELIKK